jgi:hypothetical protein
VEWQQSMVSIVKRDRPLATSQLGRENADYRLRLELLASGQWRCADMAAVKR